MKYIATAALALTVLVSGQSFAEQTRIAPENNARGTMVMPSSQQNSPFDFNHRGSGSDKSDELGVPYYN
ncbi:multiple antibiotic resistance protein MarB [Pluralibacter gergoviae]|uniref:multiple antibiotic resistance protein MarB n=1 Tax=Pluralibacter gergoviae TaxID=61647 RepID=UPI00155E0BA4|nr:multiple antibiotic resistance protein MarB [Pluralibacter gergoviae]